MWTFFQPNFVQNFIQNSFHLCAFPLLLGILIISEENWELVQQSVEMTQSKLSYSIEENLKLRMDWFYILYGLDLSAIIWIKSILDAWKIDIWKHIHIRLLLANTSVAQTNLGSFWEKFHPQKNRNLFACDTFICCLCWTLKCICLARYSDFCSWQIGIFAIQFEMKPDSFLPANSNHGLFIIASTLQMCEEIGSALFRI